MSMNEIELVLPSSLPTNEFDIEATTKRIKLLREFVQSQMIEGLDNDYAVIPGTPKKSLLQPGAQKLRLLFGLSLQVERSDRTMDRAGNLYMTSYKAKVIHTATGKVICESEGTASNLEKKYFKRNVWKELEGGGKEKVEEETPIGDLINTLDKMAQKRAAVGATIGAVGASDFFTQDLDDEIEQEQAGLRPNTDQLKKNANAEGNVDVPNCDTDKCDNAGRPMLMSKFINKQTNKYDFYCPKCKSKKGA